MAQAIAGVLGFRIGDKRLNMRGTWTYNLGRPKREGIAGVDGSHGFKLVPQIPFVAGSIADTKDLVLDDILGIENKTGTLHLANGKVIEIRNAWHAGEGTVDAIEGEMEVRFEGEGAEEVRP